jgi:hypothetical protein
MRAAKTKPVNEASIGKPHDAGAYGRTGSGAKSRGCISSRLLIAAHKFSFGLDIARAFIELKYIQGTASAIAAHKSCEMLDMA